MIASYLPESDNNLKVTENTKLHAACCLSAIYDDISSDKEREEYISVCDEFIRFVRVTLILLFQVIIQFFFILKRILFKCRRNI